MKIKNYNLKDRLMNVCNALEKLSQSTGSDLSYALSQILNTGQGGSECGSISSQEDSHPGAKVGFKPNENRIFQKDLLRLR